MNSEKEEIVKRILDYLKKNPDTGDTLEGISKWWLEMERVDHSVEKVSKALEEMIRVGKVEKVYLGGKETLFRLKRS